MGKTNTILIFGLALFTSLYFARPFLIPITTGVIVAMLVLPVCKWLERKGWSRGWAVATCVLILMLLGAGLVMVMMAPLTSFNQDFSDLEASFDEKVRQMQQYLAHQLGVSIEKQNDAVEKASSGPSPLGEYLTSFVTGFFGFIFDSILILVYIIFFLMNREKYKNFVVKLIDRTDAGEVKQILHQISKVSVQYLVGRLLSIVTLAILYTVGLLLIGLKHAAVMGSIAALLTIVPYVGTMLGGMFPAAAALLSNSGDVNPMAAIGVILLVQLVDDYLLEPFIVGEQVNVSPLAIIVGVVVGGLVWGVAGMILFIPLLGMLQIVCSHVPALQPYAYLIGTQEKAEKPYVQRVKQWVQGKRKK